MRRLMTRAASRLIVEFGGAVLFCDEKNVLGAFVARNEAARPLIIIFCLGVIAANALCAFAGNDYLQKFE